MLYARLDRCLWMPFDDLVDSVRAGSIRLVFAD